MTNDPVDLQAVKKQRIFRDIYPDAMVSTTVRMMIEALVARTGMTVSQAKSYIINHIAEYKG